MRKSCWDLKKCQLRGLDKPAHPKARIVEIYGSSCGTACRIMRQTPGRNSPKCLVIGEPSDQVERTYEDSFGGSASPFCLWCRTASLRRIHGKLKKFLRRGEQDHGTATTGENPPQDLGDG